MPPPAFAPFGLAPSHMPTQPAGTGITLPHLGQASGFFGGSCDIALFAANAKVSDGSQPPVTFDLSLSESAGSRSLNRLVRNSIS